MIKNQSIVKQILEMNYTLIEAAEYLYKIAKEYDFILCFSVQKTTY